MSSLRLMLRNVWHDRWINLAVLLGSAVATGVLVGAMLMGDSARGSLRELALLRLGRVALAMGPTDRPLPPDLADRLEQVSGADVSAVMMTTGTAARQGGQAQVPGVQLLGVRDDFWSLAPDDDPPPLPDDGVVINERLARMLDVGVGDRVLIRAPASQAFSRDAPLTPTDAPWVPLRLTVSAVASARQLGQVNLQAEQLPPPTAFVPRPMLSVNGDQANVLLVAGEATADPETFHDHLRAVYRPADLGLTVREVPYQDAWELRSDRVFLADPVASAARRVDPNALGVLTWFTYRVSLGPRHSPYAIVTAMGPLAPAPADRLPPTPVPADLMDDEIIINEWLADDIGAGEGDPIVLEYPALGPDRQLVTARRRFVVYRVTPIAGPAADPTLMPEFPGLAGVSDCRNWDPGVEIELDRIRPKDQTYWDRYRGMPKAFVSLPAGREMWANPYGNLTAVRFRPEAGTPEQLADELKRHLDPVDLGLAFRPVRERALAASQGATDFGGLFLGLSFFLIASALTLTALLQAFHVQQRGEQVGTLRAIGWPAGKIRLLLLGECLLLAGAGSVLGCGLGVAFARGLLLGLAGVWSQAVASASLTLHVHASTVASGGAIGLVASVSAMALAFRSQLRPPIRALLAGETGPAPSGRRRPVTRWLALGVIAGGSAIAAVIVLGGDARNAPATFFLAGGLLLISLLSLSAAALAARSARVAGPPSLMSLALTHAARRRGRSLATMSLLAVGCFLVLAVAANRRDPLAQAHRPDGPTGGFDYYAELASPLVPGPTSAENRRELGLAQPPLDQASFVPMRLRPGDDASCRNLNRAQQPRVLGVAPSLLAERGAFRFAASAEGVGPGHWSLLHAKVPDGEIPAVADLNTIVYALGKGVGDVVEIDRPDGETVRLRLVAGLESSVLQGQLIVAESALLKAFPGIEGYRVLLIDAPREQRGPVADALRHRLGDQGLSLESTTERLASFLAVENTYLAIFGSLGVLAMALGSLGLAVVVARNVLERRRELALLRAVGWTRRRLHRLLLAEHGLLLAGGLGIGLVSAALAVAPVLLGPGRLPPTGFWLTAGGLLVATGVGGGLWTLLASVWTLRGPLLAPLRDE